jgi:hypothetical protein
MKQKKQEQLCLLSLCSEKQEHRFLLQSLRTFASPCLPLFITGPLREGWRVLLFAFGFYFGLWLGFGVGSFWKGKELLKGNALLKGNY